MPDSWLDKVAFLRFCVSPGICLVGITRVRASFVLHGLIAEVLRKGR